MSDALDPAGVYEADEVARLVFKRDVLWFYKHRHELHAAENFPQPITKIGRPRWSGTLLIAWRDRDTRVLAPASPSLGASDNNIVNLDGALALRARAVARKRARES